MVDSKGVINISRTDLSAIKKEFATTKNIKTLKEALIDADMFLGLSVANVLNPEMIKSMADCPIVFALANPTPELYPEDILAIRDQAIVGTGRSDFPNQVNNVLGFPFIFRGALDVRATKINNEMQIAAVHALKDLTHGEAPEAVKKAYPGDNLHFGADYILPKPLDPRLKDVISTAVAQAAIDSGVAKIKNK